jgi:hypothetical protein
MVPTDSDYVLWLQRLGAHAPEAERMELVRDQREQSLPVSLCRVPAVTVAATELFELVVQVSHGDSLLW